jgi:hypothetical protein
MRIRHDPDKGCAGCKFLETSEFRETHHCTLPPGERIEDPWAPATDTCELRHGDVVVSAKEEGDE